MKNLFTFLLFGSFSICLYPIMEAQVFESESNHPWELPGFDSAFFTDHQIRFIRTHAYPEARGRARSATQPGRVYEFNDDGKMVRVIEFEENDTSYVRQLNYTQKGKLIWEHVEDKVWNKSYLSGYRFNGDNSVYLVKSYEKVNTDEKILLVTQYYIYAEDRLEEIRYVAQEQLIKKCHFVYDDAARLVSRITEDGQGMVLQKLELDYNEESRPFQTRMIENDELLYITSYVYDASGRPQEVKWVLSDQPDNPMIEVFEYELFGD